MKYIFPRQFGLHNVFTSTVDPKETTHQFLDYTLREQEIARQSLVERIIAKPTEGASSERFKALPRRLRDRAFQLVQQLQKRQAKCSYTKLLALYCPVPVC